MGVIAISLWGPVICLKASVAGGGGRGKVKLSGFAAIPTYSIQYSIHPLAPRDTPRTVGRGGADAPIWQRLGIYSCCFRRDIVDC